MSWFHCGRCGSLFQSKTGEAGNRLCSKCGFDPSPAIQNVPGEAVKPETPEDRKKIRNYELKRGQDKMLTRAMILLVVVLAALAIYKAPSLLQKKAAERISTGTAATPPPAITEEDVVLLREAFPKCAATFSRFLMSGTPEERNQFVLDPISTSTRLARFYSLNPWTNIDPQTLELEEKAVLHLPGVKTIETRWKSQDNQQFDAVFREQDGEWRLDWDQFARYGDFPWSLFLAGSGPSEGEFRLLARERLAEERKHESTISLMFYAPRFGRPGDTGFQSPEFLLSRNSRDGQLLDAAFKLARNNERVFGSPLTESNPDGLIRVRIKVRRIEKDLERRFEITGVTACHWYSVDDPGVEPLAPETAPETAEPAEN